MASDLKKVAFIGTGIMGAAIAGHIMDAGYELTVYNRTKDKAADLVARGARWADTVAEAVSAADVVFTMVGFPTDVEDVYLGREGILRSAKKGAWLIDLTTSSPQLARELAQVASQAGLHAFDCPVTGGDTGAKAGTLTLIVGATDEGIAPVRPILESFSSKIYCFGKAGAGQVAKLCNQVSLAGAMVGYSEALALAEQSGIDQELMLQMVGAGTGNSGALERLAPKSLDGDYKPGFLSEHFLKDLGLAVATAEDLELNLPGTRTAFDLYDLLCRVGGSRLGTQAVSLLYQDEATSVAAGLDWSLLEDWEDEEESGHEGCGHDGCDGHGGCGHADDSDHECGCGHHHDHRGE